MAAKEACSSGVDVAVVVEDDAYPLGDFKNDLERTIDVLESLGPNI